MIIHIAYLFFVLTLNAFAKAKLYSQHLHSIQLCNNYDKVNHHILSIDIWTNAHSSENSRLRRFTFSQGKALHIVGAYLWMFWFINCTLLSLCVQIQQKKMSWVLDKKIENSAWLKIRKNLSDNYFTLYSAIVLYLLQRDTTSNNNELHFKYQENTTIKSISCEVLRA